MPATASGFVLYIIARTDLASMNRGMFAAHAAHAARHVDGVMQNAEQGSATAAIAEGAYARWCAETPQRFGTVLTLDGGGLEAVRGVVAQAHSRGFAAAMTHDPEYPVFDGDYVHLVPTDTCGWVFGSRAELADILGHLPLCR
jgi:hypothetical protein